MQYKSELLWNILKYMADCKILLETKPIKLEKFFVEILHKDCKWKHSIMNFCDIVEFGVLRNRICFSKDKVSSTCLFKLRLMIISKLVMRKLTVDGFWWIINDWFLSKLCSCVDSCLIVNKLSSRNHNLKKCFLMMVLLSTQHAERHLICCNDLEWLLHWPLILKWRWHEYALISDD